MRRFLNTVSHKKNKKKNNETFHDPASVAFPAGNTPLPNRAICHMHDADSETLRESRLIMFGYANRSLVVTSQFFFCRQFVSAPGVKEFGNMLPIAGVVVVVTMSRQWAAPGPYIQGNRQLAMLPFDRCAIYSAGVSQLVE